MAIPKPFIDQVVSDANVVEVVGRYVELKKTGSNYSGLCPFHSEKSPSFTVSETKQFYHCFGCGAHGNAIGFLLEYTGVSFPEAVERLAAEQGKIMPAPDYSPQEASRKAQEDTLFKALGAAKDVFQGSLRSHAHAIHYLKGRGLTGATAQKFGIGYAHFDDVSKQLPSFGVDILVDAGLLVRNEQSGDVYDRYRKRVVFPIHNERGVVIGFGGRVVNDDDKPKYINSPETAVFQKGEELFGLYFAKNEIRKTRQALLFEGYLDVIMLHQHGDERAVGALGTSMTESQLRRLFRLGDEVIFCFDGDRAGRAAADRAAQMALASMEDGKTARFLTLPGDHDPDSYVREFGIDAWRDEVEHSSIPLSSKIMGMLTGDVDLNIPEKKVGVAREAAKYLAMIKRAPLFASALRSTIENVLQIPVGQQSSVEPAPVQATVPAQVQPGFAVAPSSRAFYLNVVQLCGLGADVRAHVPDALIDDFSELLIGWFAVAPSDHEARVQLAASSRGALNEVLSDGLEGVSQRRRWMTEESLAAEVLAIADAINREAQRRDAAARTSALFD